MLYVLHNRFIIEQTPLQLYSSALIFSPVNSIVRKQFERQLPAYIQRVPTISKNWSPLLQTFESRLFFHESPMDFSDSRLLAEKSFGQMTIWDVATGAEVGNIRIDGMLWSFAFTTNQSLLLVFSWGQTGVAAHLRDITADITTVLDERTSDQRLEESCARRRFECVRLSRLSPNRGLLATTNDIDGCHECNTIRLWDIIAHEFKQLEGHAVHIDAFGFSPEGRMLASASRDGTIRLWDVATCATLHLVQTAADPVVFTDLFLYAHECGQAEVQTHRYEYLNFLDTLVGSGFRALLVGPTISRIDRGSFSPGTGRIAVSTKNKWLALPNKDRINIWDAVTGSVQQTLEGHQLEVESLAFSPNDKLLASRLLDQTIRIWSIERANPQQDSGDGVGPTFMCKGVLLQTLSGHSDTIESLDFSPDGVHLASASRTATRLWNLTTYTYLPDLNPRLFSVYGTVFSPDGKLAASQSLSLCERTKCTTVLDCATGAALPSFLRHISAAAFSADGGLAALALHDKSIVLWHVATAQVVRTLEGHLTLIGDLTFSPNGKLLASAPVHVSGGAIKLWDTATGTTVQVLACDLGCIKNLVFSPDSRTLAGASKYRTVRLWDALTGATLQTLELEDGIGFVTPIFSPDGTLIASENGLWNVASGNALQGPDSHAFETLALSPDGKLMASVPRQHRQRIIIWAIEDRVTLHTFGTGRGKKESPTFSPNSKLLAYGDPDALQVQVGDVSTGAVLHTLACYSRPMAFSPDSKLLALSTGEHGEVWDMATGTIIHLLEHERSLSLKTLAFSPDGKLVAWLHMIIDRRLILVLWNTASGAVVSVVENPGMHSRRFEYLHVAFSPNGQLITLSAPGAVSSTTRIWDAATGAQLHEFDAWTSPGEFRHFSAVSPHRRGQFATISSNRDAIMIWNEEKGTMKLTSCRTVVLGALAFSRDGQVLASASGGGFVELWDTGTCSALCTLEAQSLTSLDKYYFDKFPIEVVFSMDSKWVALLADSKIRLWNAVTGTAMDEITVHKDTKDLVFSKIGPYLYTNRGRLAPRCLFNPTSSLARQDYGSSLFVKGNWVTRDSGSTERILVLPVDYRRVCVSPVNNMIAIIHTSGRVSFVQLSPSMG